MRLWKDRVKTTDLVNKLKILKELLYLIVDFTLTIIHVIDPICCEEVSFCDSFYLAVDLGCTIGDLEKGYISKRVKRVKNLPTALKTESSRSIWRSRFLHTSTHANSTACRLSVNWERLYGSNLCAINGDTIFSKRLGHLVKVANTNTVLWLSWTSSLLFFNNDSGVSWNRSGWSLTDHSIWRMWSPGRRLNLRLSIVWAHSNIMLGRSFFILVTIAKRFEHTYRC